MVDLLVNCLMVHVHKSILYMQFVEASCLEELESNQAKIFCRFREAFKITKWLKLGHFPNLVVDVF